MLTRRRFLTLTAALPLAKAGAALAAPLQIFTGHALGAKASLRLAHPDAAAIAARAFGEIDRLENIFSLYRPQSALMRLNATSVLAEPPFELLECLTLAGRVHAVSGGRFDPTVQPLWALQAVAASEGRLPDPRSLATAERGWHRVRLAADRIALDPGMGLTLNGIAQGYIADRVADLLAAEGLSDVLIDTGELRAPGTTPRDRAWRVRLQDGSALPLHGRALATSSPTGTSFDAAGRQGHILSPATGQPSTAPWRAISIMAPTAALADALSTAACLMGSKAEITALCEMFQDTTLALLV